MALVSLDPQEYGFAALAGIFQASDAFVGWNIIEPSGDVMLYDKGLNCLMGRQVLLDNGVKIKAELFSKFLFGDLTTYSRIISSLSNNTGNVVVLPIDQASAFPKDEIASLLN